MMSATTKYPKTVFIMLSGFIIGSFIYRYYSFALFYQEQKRIEAETKKISRQAREIFLQNQTILNQSNCDDRPRIVIKIETD